MNPDAGAGFVADNLQSVDALAEPQRGPVFPQMVAELVGDFPVDEGQQAIALVDQRHPNPSAAKMLAYSQPITPAPTTARVRGKPIEIEDVVAGEDAFAVERDVRSAGVFRPGGDDDFARLDRARTGAVDIVEADRVGRGKGRLGRKQFDIVAHQLMAGHVDLVLDHPVGAKQQVLHRDVLLDSVGGAVEFPRAIAAKLERRLAQRLRRDRSQIDAAAAEHGLAFDNRDALVELGALDRGALSGRPGADHQKVVVEEVSGHALGSSAPNRRAPIGTCHEPATRR